MIGSNQVLLPYLNWKSDAQSTTFYQFHLIFFYRIPIHSQFLNDQKRNDGFLHVWKTVVDETAQNCMDQGEDGEEVERGIHGVPPATRQQLA